MKSKTNEYKSALLHICFCYETVLVGMLILNIYDVKH